MPNVDLNDVDAIVTPKQLAEIIGCSARQIDVLRTEGVLKSVRSWKFRGQRFRLSDAVQACLRHERERLREQFASRNGSSSAYEAARTRRMAALALVEEAKARQVTGELIERAQVVAVMTHVITHTKSRLLAVPTSCMHQLVGKSSPRETREIVHERIVAALRDLARFDVKKLQQKSKNGATDDQS
jgi:phage terminase Nu1 subunit (DNA packaging protein)